MYSEMPTGLFPAGLCGCSYQHINQFTSELKAAALQQRTTACKRTQISWVRHAGKGLDTSEENYLYFTI